jgi:hypothetical protein
VNEVSICYKHPSGVIADLLLGLNLISRYTQERTVNLFVNNITIFFHFFLCSQYLVLMSSVFMVIICTLQMTGFMKKVLISFCCNISL